MKKVQFHKMEGAGNDYVYLDHRRERFLVPDPAFIQQASERRRGAGSDGVIELLASEKADCFMNMWNADASPSAMCGNGLRCVAFLVHRNSGQKKIAIETRAGIFQAEILEASDLEARVEINMGPPVFEASKIPVAAAGAPAIIKDFQVPGLALPVTAIGMGNPHCIIFYPDSKSVEALDLEQIGPAIQKNPFFPESVNVEFVAPEAANSLFQRTYERGSGETLACGSGACAAHVAAVLAGFVPAQGSVRLLGGTLQIRWEGTANQRAPVFMSGPARLVYSGNFYVAN